MKKNLSAEAIGPRIRRLRTAKGLSLTQLARLSDVTWNTIARIERGEMQPRRSTVRCLLLALGEKPEEPPPPPPKVEKIDISRRLSELRAAAGLSIRQLAELVKMNRGLLWRLEQGTQGATPEQGKKVLGQLERLLKRALA